MQWSGSVALRIAVVFIPPQLRLGIGVPLPSAVLRLVHSFAPVLLVETQTSKRDLIFNALLHNVNDIIHQEGVNYVPRRKGICGLVRDGLLDPKIALVMIDE
jgi:hypothetical protein